MEKERHLKRLGKGRRQRKGNTGEFEKAQGRKKSERKKYGCYNLRAGEKKAKKQGKEAEFGKVREEKSEGRE